MNKFFIEFIGTTILGVAMFSSHNPFISGFALIISKLIGDKISGGNFNPAISLASGLSGKLDKYDMFKYIVAQFCGGFLAYELSILHTFIKL